MRQETLKEIEDFIGAIGVVNNCCDAYLWRVDKIGIIAINEPLAIQTIRNNLKAVFSRAGFPDFYPHALRHPFATDLQRCGVSIEEIKEMLGHKVWLRQSVIFTVWKDG